MTTDSALDDSQAIWLFGAQVPCADLFDSAAIRRLIDSHPGRMPAILVTDSAHVEAFASRMTPDARILVNRLMPGPVIAVLEANEALPHDTFPEGVAVAVLPDMKWPSGGPVLCMIPDSGGGQNGPTVIDVRVSPARIIRYGSMPRSEIERYILLERED